jgi:TonB family protein
MVLLSAAMLISCAGSRQDRIPEREGDVAAEKTEKENNSNIELVVTSEVDTDPEPVGGLEAIHAAVQEPEEVWKANKTGATVVEARVDANGKVVGTKVYRSSGYPGMDAEAMLAVSRVRWKPARKKNKPVDAVVRVTIDFNSSMSSKVW